MTRRVLEVETLDAFDRRIARVTRLRGWFVQGLDLTGRAERLHAVDPTGAVFLGCHFDPGTEDALRRAGALIFPRLPDLPFEPYRGSRLRRRSALRHGPLRGQSRRRRLHVVEIG